VNTYRQQTCIGLGIKVDFVLAASDCLTERTVRPNTSFRVSRTNTNAPLLRTLSLGVHISAGPV